MKVTYSEQVKEELRKYKVALTRAPYSLSQKRIREKRRAISQYLRKVIPLYITQNNNSPTFFRICDKKDLGQIFDVNGNPILTNLRMTTFQDKSKTQWSISFLFRNKSNMTIMYLKQTSFIRENLKIIYTNMKNKNQALYESIMRKVSKTVKRSLNESVSGGDYVRLVIIDHSTHELFIEDVKQETIDSYGGEQEYIDDMYNFNGDYSWDYIIGASYMDVDSFDDPVDIDFSSLV